MQGMVNQMRRAAQEAMAGRAVTRHGIVDGYDPDSYAVRVRLQPDDTLTDWIPLKAVAVGNGWGAFFAPNIGDAIEIDFQEDDGEVGSAGWRFFNDSDRPLSVPAGETWLVHQTGTAIKLVNDGAIETNAMILRHSGEVAVAGSLSTTGNLSAGTGASGSFTTPTGQTVTVLDGIIVNIM